MRSPESVVTLRPMSAGSSLPICARVIGSVAVMVDCVPWTGSGLPALLSHGLTVQISPDSGLRKRMCLPSRVGAMEPVGIT